MLLKDEALDPAFDFKEAAALADGYSGSDLKNLCIAAAYCPIREFLEKERAAMRAAAAAKKEAAAAGGAAAAQPVAAAPVQPAGPRPAALAAVAAPAPVTEPVVLRRIAMDDFKEALKQVTASTHSDSATMGELERWVQGAASSKVARPRFGGCPLGVLACLVNTRTHARTP